MARIIGCRDLHIANILTDAVGTAPTFESPERVPSLIGISVKDTVENTKFYSDDTVEQSFSKTSAKEVEIELGFISNELEAKLTGKKYENGMLVQNGDDSAPEVALMFRAPKSKGNAFRYMVLYKGTLSRTDSEYVTQEDKVEGSTIKLTGVFIPLASTGDLASTCDSDDAGATTVVADWFTEVQLPKAKPPVESFKTGK